MTTLAATYPHVIPSIVQQLEIAPVTIRFQWAPRLRSHGFTRAFWSATPENYSRHVVLIRTDTPPHVIPWMLAHELCHVWQLETRRMQFTDNKHCRLWDGVRHDRRVGRYCDLPEERDANAFACSMFGDEPWHYYWGVCSPAPRLDAGDRRLRW